MAKYAIYAPVQLSVYLGEVEADTPEEAVEKGEALHPGSIGLCHQCTKKTGDHLELGDVIAEPLD